MKKIYLHGSFMNDNFGDYLLFKVVSDWIYEVDKKNTILSYNVSSKYDNLVNFQRCSAKSAINESDIIVLCGGGYLGEPNNNKLRWTINFIKNHGTQFLRIVRSKKPYIIIGVGAGPQTSYICKCITKKLCNGAEVVSVRDVESKEFLKKIGVKKNVEVVPDIVMSTTTNYLKMDDLKKNSDNQVLEDIKTVLIHLTSRVSVKNNFLVNDIKRYAEENENIKFIISSDQGREVLKERNRFWAKLLSGKDVEIYDYRDPSELLTVINKSDIIITDKLHVGIVATRLYKKVISIAGHSKTKRFYKQIGRSQFTKDNKDIKSGEIYSLIKNCDSMNNEQVDNINRLALENKIILQKFIDK